MSEKDPLKRSLLELADTVEKSHDENGAWGLRTLAEAISGEHRQMIATLCSSMSICLLISCVMIDITLYERHKRRKSDNSESEKYNNYPDEKRRLPREESVHWLFMGIARNRD